MKSPLQCPYADCDRTILHPTPGLRHCPCRYTVVRLWREPAPFGGATERVRLATPDERREFKETAHA